MRGIIPVLLFSQLVLAGVRVEKVLETTSTEEYNQWVERTRVRCPELDPVLIQSQHEVKGTLHRYTIRYYSECGKIIKEEILEGGLDSEGICYISYTNDRAVYIRKKIGGSYQITVKDEAGRELFSLEDNKWLITPTGIGVYVEDIDPEYPVDKTTVLRVFDEDGRVVGTLKGFGGINLENIYTPADRRYCVFQGGRFIIMLNRGGKELWRYEMGRDVFSLFIAKDGSRVGVNCGNVLIFDENGNIVQKYKPFGEAKYLISCALSDDGRWLVVGHSGVKFYNNETGELVWKDTVTLKGRNELIKQVHVMKNSNLILVLCRSHNMYIFDKTGRLLLVHNLKLGKRLTSKRIPDESKPKWFPFTIKKIEVLTQNWFSDVVGEYLIINKYSNGVRLRTQGDTKIVYRIHYTP